VSPPESRQPDAVEGRGELLDVLEGADGSLLELVDHLLNQGVVVTGDVVLGLAGVDLVYLRLSAVLCAADRLLGRGEPG
jgi:gas vesicle protein GvpA/GvpJ/GvpM family